MTCDLLINRHEYTMISALIRASSSCSSLGINYMIRNWMTHFLRMETGWYKQDNSFSAKHRAVNASKE
ncbi:hypothetical protein CAEBREN_22650 [Caenorhabditis brenneri]|uniref:Uncharacterized protein n=1 Tax=Caenorhabditis brenneri TaxID=135651 RepID=G0MMQ8_CAEBE|nr:hypothetical protein CAEBREN_22650 [Caenorhabditis brenneri]